MLAKQNVNIYLSIDKHGCFFLSPEIATRTAERWYSVDARRLFEAYQERDQMLRWFGPANLERWLKFDHDLRAGGALTFGFTSDGGQEFWGRCDFIDIDPDRRIEYISSITDPTGVIIRPLPPSDWLLRVHTVVSMVSSGGGTILRVAVTPYGAGDQERAFLALKWTEMRARFATSFNILEAFLTQRAVPGRHELGAQ